MFVFFNCVIVLAFVALAVVLPVRFSSPTAKVLARLRDSVMRKAAQAVFESGASRDRTLVDCARVTGGFALFLFLLLALRQGVLLENTPDAVWAVIFLAAMAIVASIVLVVTAVSLATAIPKTKGYALLSRFGFRGLWVVDPKSPSIQARDGIASRLRTTTRLGLLDVTGFELLGKGAGTSGGLLHDALDSLPDIPVEVLLLKPDARVLDPEEVMATVFQSILAEMEVSSNTYMKRIQATLNAVAALNNGRPQGGKIEVRFYTEKPTVRALVFDQSVLVWPWHPRESQIPLPVLEVLKGTTQPTFYEAFRRNFARLWGSARPLASGAPQPEKRVQVTLVNA
jgi:hypothetical protein